MPGLAGRTGADWVGLAVEGALFVVTNAAALERILTTLAVLSMAGLGLAGWLYLGRLPSRASRRSRSASAAAAGLVRHPPKRSRRGGGWR